MTIRSLSDVVRWEAVLTVGRRLRAGRAVLVLRVPGLRQADLLHRHAGLRRVDEVTAADVDSYVPLGVEVDQVTRLKVGQRHVRQGVPLLVGVARDGYPGVGPGGHSHTRAVEAIRARTRSPEDVVAAELVISERDNLFRLRAGRAGVVTRRRPARARRRRSRDRGLL